VSIQLLLFIAYLFPISIISINLPEWFSYSGLVVLGLGAILGAVALLQLNTNLSPFPTPVSNGKLITNGAFAIARHPIYSALIFFFSALTIALMVALVAIELYPTLLYSTIDPAYSIMVYNAAS